MFILHRTLQPRKSKPFVINVIFVFSFDRARPLSRRKDDTIGLTSFSSNSCVKPEIIKSSAYLIRFTPLLIFSLLLLPSLPKRLSNNFSRPSKVKLASIGEILRGTSSCGIQGSSSQLR